LREIIFPENRSRSGTSHSRIDPSSQSPESAPISQVAFVFQQPVLFPRLNVRQNVGFALVLKSGPQLPEERRNQAVEKALSDVGLSQASHVGPVTSPAAWLNASR
jgi:ABC-type nitrate/sulfonate/bicarbonate transport system ATPase subunit